MQFYLNSNECSIQAVKCYVRFVIPVDIMYPIRKMEIKRGLLSKSISNVSIEYWCFETRLLNILYQLLCTKLRLLCVRLYLYGSLIMRDVIQKHNTTMKRACVKPRHFDLWIVDDN